MGTDGRLGGEGRVSASAGGWEGRGASRIPHTAGFSRNHLPWLRDRARQLGVARGPGVPHGMTTNMLKGPVDGTHEQRTDFAALETDTNDPN